MIKSFAVRTLRRVAVLVVAAGAFNAPLHAQFYQNSTGLSNAATTITFDEHVLAFGTALSNEYAAEGILFGNGLHYGPQGATAFPGVNGNNIGNFSPVATPFSIYFTSVQTRAGWGFATNPNVNSFEALLAGNVVASSGAVSTGFTDPNAYFGFDGVAFDEIRFTTNGDGAALVDNIQYGDVNVVPEPGTFALLGVMLIPGAAVLRRRRASK